MTKAKKRSHNYILALDDETAEKLENLASHNDHAPSKQAFLIIQKVLKNYILKDENGNDIFII